MSNTAAAGGGSQGMSGLAAQLGQAMTTSNNSYIGSGGSGFPGIYTGMGGLSAGSLIGATSPSSMTPQQLEELKKLYEQVAQITGTVYTLPAPPTPEETVELEALEQQRQNDMKQKQVNAFKRVPAAIRQRLVDDILWARELETIEVVDQSKSPRQLELESKKSVYGSLGGSSAGTIGQWISTVGLGSTITSTFPYPMPSQVARPVLPSRMTEEDVLQAHNEATMEEECLSQS